MTELLAHSPLGASGAERWMKCPGSIGLSEGVPRDDDDNEFSGPGLAAHAVAAECLTTRSDAWTLIGYRVHDDLLYEPGAEVYPSDAILVDKEMADAVQVYLDAVCQRHPDQNQGNTWIERRFHCPSLHELFYGTADFAHLSAVDSTMEYPLAPPARLDVWDFKYGAGIVVEVKENPQLMYYACGILADLDLWNTVDRVTLHIAQPRGFHFDGPIRMWSISVDDLSHWLWDVLEPAMNTALGSTDTASGEHCRFCPVRGRKCPQLMSDLGELEKLVTKMNKEGGAAKLSAGELGRILDLMVPAMIARKQALKNATGMLNAGHKVPGWKLAKARSNRQFKDGSADAARKKFGPLALTLPVLKSPAQMEALPEGDSFVERWAFKPDAGYTVVPESDSRMAISKDTKALFSPVGKKK